MRPSGARGRVQAAAATVLAAGCVALAAVAPASALETDQYLALGAEITDSTEAANAYLNRSIEDTLAKLGPRAARRLSCEDLPPKIYRDLFPSLLWSPWRRFLGHSPEVDRFPKREVGYFEYLDRSLYTRLSFPFIMPLGRTIEVAGVHLGIDKLGGHMFGFGRRYYKRYRRGLRSGLDERQAMRRAIEWGLTIERFFVGGLIDGVFSHADLEANYQGLLLARDLCEADPPHLVRVEGRWRLSRPVDLTSYVNPLFDESYNPSHFVGHRWRQVRPVARESVCERLERPEAARRFERYRRQEPESLSQRIVAEFFAGRGVDPRRQRSVEAVCDGPAAGERAAATARPLGR